MDTPRIPDGIYSDQEADAKRPAIKAGFSHYPDHVLRHVIQSNRAKWARHGHPHPIKREQLLVADVAAEILQEREQG